VASHVWLLASSQSSQPSVVAATRSRTGDRVAADRLEHSVDPNRIHVELFYGYDKSIKPVQDYAAASVTVRLSGSEQTLELAAGDRILEAALQVRDDAPYACMGGACGACKARLIAGTVEMDHNFALRSADVDAGYILTCQSHPTSPAVTIDYDA